MTQGTIRVGFVGAGNNTRRRHIPGFQKQPGVELVAVANRTKESGERVAREFGLARVYEDWRDLVRARDVDAVCIGTWPYMHCEITVAALEAGKHVLCEARMAMDAAEGRRMLAAARRASNLVAQLVPAPHTLEVDATLQSLLAEGYAGEVLAVELQAAQGRFVDPDEPLHWRHDAALSGFNVLTMGIWYEAMMRWLGPARRVMAMTKIAVPRRRDDRGAWHEVRVPDHVDLLAELPGGAERGVDLRAGGHAPARGRRAAPVGRAARRGRAPRDSDPRRAAERLAGRRGVRQRDPRPRDGPANDLRGRRPLHGFHRGRGPERGPRPGRRGRRPLNAGARDRCARKDPRR